MTNKHKIGFLKELANDNQRQGMLFKGTLTDNQKQSGFSKEQVNDKQRQVRLFKGTGI